MNFSLACTLIPFLRDARIPFTLLASQWNPNFLWFSYGFPMDFVNLPEGHPLVSGLDLLFELTPLINQFWFLGWSSKQIEWMLKEHDPEMSRVFSISMLNYWTEMSQYFSKCILTYIPMKSTIKFEYLEIYIYINRSVYIHIYIYIVGIYLPPISHIPMNLTISWNIFPFCHWFP